MFARVFDKEHQLYYKSIIYCGINQGYYRQYIVLNPYTKCFELVDYIDKSTKDSFLLVETIQDDRSEWVIYEKAFLLKYKSYCKNHGKKMTIDFLFGYKDICENYDFITAVLERKSVPVNEFNIRIRSLHDTDSWNYIFTQSDADDFMKMFAGFHDSTLDKLVYEEGYGSNKVIATFDNSGWYGIVEICFEGVIAVNIRPKKQNHFRDIYGASLIVEEETVFWTDDYTQDENAPGDTSCIKALNMKWRKIG